MESYTSFETGFIQVMENLESVESKHFILQAWKVMEFNILLLVLEGRGKLKFCLIDRLLNLLNC